MKHTIGISEMKLSNQRDDILVTYSLGSCIGVTVYDPVACAGGMIHCMLPLSRIDPEKVQVSPCMFVDTGIPMLFEEAYRLGAQKSRIILKVAGAAQILDEQGTFKIGERNYAVLRRILWKNNVFIAAEDVGGTISRTMSLEIGTGRVIIKSRGREVEL
jgi:chemotaxis protein CheD